MNAAAPDTIEHEVEDVRRNITTIVSELDRRRHEWVDWRFQVRRHAGALGVAAAGVLLALGATVGFGIWRRRRNDKPMIKARRWRQAFSRALSNPELVARPSPTIGKKALAAAASAVAGATAKAVANRVLAPARSPAHDHPA